MTHFKLALMPSGDRRAYPRGEGLRPARDYRRGNRFGHDLALWRLAPMKDMTCSFAAAWVRETRAARNAAQNNTTVGVPGARCQERHAGGPPPSGWSTFGVKWKSSAPARSSTRGGVLGKGGTMQRQVSTATPSLGDGLACRAHRSQAMRPVDTLPGGLGSLKSY